MTNSFCLGIIQVRHCVNTNLDIQELSRHGLKHGLDWTRENMDWAQKTWTQVENMDSGSNASASSIDELPVLARIPYIYRIVYISYTTRCRLDT